MKQQPRATVKTGPVAGSVISTFGHGTRSLDEMAALLSEFGIDVVADVRRFPGSRRHPHTAREVLAASLPERGIAYEWWGDELGGRRSPRPGSPNDGWNEAAFQGFADHMDSPGFIGARDRLIERSMTDAMAIMCAETLWWRCHRRLIADALHVAGVAVTHILSSGDARPHQPTAFLVVEDGRLLYPATAALFGPDATSTATESEGS